MSSPANESISKTYRPRRPSFFLSLAPTTSSAYFPPSAVVDTTTAVDPAPVERPAARRSSSVTSDASKSGVVGFRFLALGHGPEEKDEKTQ